jgi:glycosyltransferase involved in cell wall biosynthesis
VTDHSHKRPGLTDRAAGPSRSTTFRLPDPKRVDLHCHSAASTKVGEALLKVIACPESYSPPADVYAQAKRRGMDFVAITDHDTLDGVLSLADRADVLVGEELTCWFPEDQCKIHLLVWGITPDQHDRLQAVAKDIYQVADIVERERIAHSVAHPIYRQNDRLERWHLERLLLLFKGFECLNGAHAPSHREAFEPLLDRLDRAEMQRLAEVHNIVPKWPEPWFKSRTAGSDDHGLLNVGRTWTEFPPEVKTIDDVLTCLREGTCRPAGEAGSVLKLAHTFYGVGVRYNAQQIGHDTGPTMTMLQVLVGQRPNPSKAQWARAVVKGRIKSITRKVKRAFGLSTRPTHEDALLVKLFLGSVAKRFRQHPKLLDRMNEGLPPLGEHDEVFKLIGGISRDVYNGIADHFIETGRRGDLIGFFEGVGALAAQQFLLAPYYFALFHQNKERHLLSSITRTVRPMNASSIRVGLFTDTFDDINGVGRFIRDMGEQAIAADVKLSIATSVSAKKLRFDHPARTNFDPMLARPMPFYSTLDLTIPPVLDMLEWADRQQFDAIHISTPGPVGMVGFLAAKMLRVPVLSTYHTDFPAYVDELTHDHRLTDVTRSFMSWFYKRSKTVFSRSTAYHFNLRDLGVEQDRLRTIPAGINTTKFNPRHRDESVWQKYGVDRAGTPTKKHKLLYAGRISTEKNLPLLVETFKQLCTRREDVALVIAGEGPYETKMREALAGLPAFFTGPLNDTQLPALYATASLFLFPSRTDTLGQVVMESQASALPCLVSSEGGPREIINPDESGLVLSATNPQPWVEAIDQLLNNPDRLASMRDAALLRSRRYDLARTFQGFWSEHVQAVQQASAPTRDAIDSTQHAHAQPDQLPEPTSH